MNPESLKTRLDKLLGMAAALSTGGIILIVTLQAFARLCLPMIIAGTLTPDLIMQTLIRSTITTDSLMVLVGFASLFSWILASEQIPQRIAESLLNLTQNKFLMLMVTYIPSISLALPRLLQR